MKKFIIGLLCSGVVFTGGLFFINRPSVDERFITSVAQGLEARWDYQERNEYDALNDENEILLASTQLDLKLIHSFEDKTFEDSNLQVLAQKYIQSVSDQVSALESSRFDTGLLNGSMFDRMEIISILVEKYDLHVNEHNAKNLETMVKQGQIVTKSKAILEHSSIANAGLSLADIYKDFMGSSINDDLSGILHFIDKGDTRDETAQEPQEEITFKDITGEITGWLNDFLDNNEINF